MPSPKTGNDRRDQNLGPWQIVFLAGFSLTILLTAVLYGTGAVLGWVALLTFLLGLLATLMGRRILPEALQRLLNRPRGLLSLTAAVWVAAFVLVALLVRRSSPDNAIRVTYLVLEDHAVDAFLTGRLSKEWEERLGGQPFIVPNEVYQELLSLRDQFAVSGPEATVFAVRKRKPGSEEVEEEQQEGVPPWFPSETFLPLTWEGFNEPYVPFAIDDAEKVLGEVLFDERWIPWIRRTEAAELLAGGLDKPLVLDPLSAWRLAGERDLMRYLSNPELMDAPFLAAKLSMLRHLTLHRLPPDFLALDRFPLECGASYGEQLLTPKLRLHVVAIENLREDPIRLSDMAVQVHGDDRLRSLVENEAGLGAATVRFVQPLPQEILAPGEVLAVPLAILFGDPFRPALPAGRQDADGSPLPQPAASSVTVKISRLIDINLQNFEERTVSFRAASLTAFFSRERAFRELPVRPYVFGPTVKILSLRVDREPVQVRQAKPGVFALVAGAEIGSCPYVYALGADGSWTRQGRILEGLDARSRKSITETPVVTTDGRILIREEEDEVTVLDQLYLRSSCPGEGERLLFPDLPTLVEADGHSVRLRRGEEVLVSFENVPSRPGCRSILGAVGYYVPFPALDPKAD